jgi:HAD superfamily hydrolase (TIGR01509 family)
MQLGVDSTEIAETFAQTTASLTPHAAMIALIHDLKATGISVYMMTNIPQPDFDQLRARDYIWDAFNGVFASGYVGMRKPDTCFYEHVLKEICVPPQETVFVDDKMENLLPARKLGITSLHCVNILDSCQQVRAMFGL